MSVLEQIALLAERQTALHAQTQTNAHTSPSVRRCSQRSAGQTGRRTQQRLARLDYLLIRLACCTSPASSCWMVEPVPASTKRLCLPAMEGNPYSYRYEWCLPTIQETKESSDEGTAHDEYLYSPTHPATGLLYIKSHKASSSACTCEGINLAIHCPWCWQAGEA